jgi:hypothetical protein
LLKFGFWRIQQKTDVNEINGLEEEKIGKSGDLPIRLTFSHSLSAKPPSERQNAIRSINGSFRNAALQRWSVLRRSAMGRKRTWSNDIAFDPSRPISLAVKTLDQEHEKHRCNIWAGSCNGSVTFSYRACFLWPRDCGLLNAKKAMMTES